MLSDKPQQKLRKDRNSRFSTEMQESPRRVLGKYVNPFEATKLQDILHPLRTAAAKNEGSLAKAAEKAPEKSASLNRIALDHLRDFAEYRVFMILIIFYTLNSVVHNGARSPKWALWGFSLGSFKIIFS